MDHDDIFNSFASGTNHHSIVRSLLLGDPENKVWKAEELLRAWKPIPHNLLCAQFPSWCQNFAIRVWDGRSASQLDSESAIAFEATGLNCPLNTKAGRINAFTIHADHTRWEPTPFISATFDRNDLDRRAKRQHSRNRGTVYLTAINLRARWRACLPILNAEAEMKYYGVKDPYDGDYFYNRNELICPWVITQAEVVQTWCWDDVLEKLERMSSSAWVELIVIPAVDLHESLCVAELEHNKQVPHFTKTTFREDAICLHPFADSSNTNPKFDNTAPDNEEDPSSLIDDLENLNLEVLPVVWQHPVLSDVFEDIQWLAITSDTQIMLQAIPIAPHTEPQDIYVYYLELTEGHSSQFFRESGAGGFEHTCFVSVKNRNLKVRAAWNFFIITWNLQQVLMGKKESYSVKRFEDNESAIAWLKSI